MKSSRFAAFAAVAGFFVAAFAAPAIAQDKPKPEAKPAAKQEPKKDAKADHKDHAHDGPLCPVMGEPIDPKIYGRYKGQRVYLCCSECVDAFKKDPEKYAKAIKAQWDAMPALRMQTKCPVTGEKLDMSVFVEEPHYDLFFANADAKSKFQKDRKAYESKLAECFTYQTKCPVSGTAAKASFSKEIGGKTIYFCCGGCAGKANDETVKKAEEQAKANEVAYAKQRGTAKKP